MNTKVSIIDRKTKLPYFEPKFHEGLLDLSYRSDKTKWLLNILSSHFFANLYGRYLDSKFSRGSIKKFAHDQSIPLEEYDNYSYNNFNEFFVRRFKPGKRTFCQTPNRLTAPAEGKYATYKNISKTADFLIKGHNIDLKELIQDEDLVSKFVGGSLIVARLSPRDYHRFHFFDDGEVICKYSLSGPLYSVGLNYLAKRPDTLFKNQRNITLLKTKNFGEVLYIAVGGLSIGKIVESHSSFESHLRGQEKGYFKFGGSTIIVIFQKDKVIFDQDICENSKKGIETFVKLGNVIGKGNTICVN